MSSWQIQEAKQRFSEVLRRAQGEPQIITRHGEEVAALISVELYHQLTGPKVELGSYLLHGPHADDLPELVERDMSELRPVDVDELV